MAKPADKPGPLAVDLDGTLAHPCEPFDCSKVGEPYPEMLQRVKDEITAGRKVSIFTARAARDDDKMIKPIRAWLKEHGLPEDMEITAVKDPKFAEFWDDRARQAKEGELAEKLAAGIPEVLRTQFKKAIEPPPPTIPPPGKVAPPQSFPAPQEPGKPLPSLKGAIYSRSPFLRTLAERNISALNEIYSTPEPATQAGKQHNIAGKAVLPPGGTEVTPAWFAAEAYGPDNFAEELSKARQYREANREVFKDETPLNQQFNRFSVIHDSPLGYFGGGGLTANNEIRLGMPASDFKPVLAQDPNFILRHEARHLSNEPLRMPGAPLPTPAEVAARQFGPAALHDGSKPEMRNYMQALQEWYFKNYGKRFTSPEEFLDFQRGAQLENLKPDELHKWLQDAGMEYDAARLFRGLQEIRRVEPSKYEEALKWVSDRIPGFVSNDVPALAEKVASWWGKLNPNSPFDDEAWMSVVKQAQALQGEVEQEKSAAEIGKRKRIEEHEEQFCPHCGFVFREKGGPIPSDYTAAQENRLEDYDMLCRECNGIIDYPEMTDEEIDSHQGWGGEDMKIMLREQRDARRRRKANRQASPGPRKNVQPADGEKAASLRPPRERLARLRMRRGEAYSEGPRSTVDHDGQTFLVDDLLAAAGDPEDYNVEDLMWALENASLDPQRVEAADPDVPGVLTTHRDKLTVLDGTHRLAKARQEGRKTIKMRSVTPEWMSTNAVTSEKAAIVKRKGDKWQLLTADGKRVLGTHDSADAAYRQEYAIQKSQERAKAASPDKPAAKFYQPENYDCYDDCSKHGWKLWAGQNDWENATTWVWCLQPEAPQRGEHSMVWVELKYPNGYKPGDDHSKLDEDRRMREMVKSKFLRKWLDVAMRIQRQEYPTATSMRPDDVRAALEHEDLKPWVNASGIMQSELTAKEASVMGPVIPKSGPHAILHRLRNLDLEALEKQAREDIASGKVTKRDRGVKMLNVITGLKRNELKPEDLMIKQVPVIPPAFRPYSFAGGTYIPGSANELYQDLLKHKELHDETLQVFGEAGASATRANILGAVRALFGYGEPVSKKVRDRAPKGFLMQIAGSNPKLSFPQAKMLAKPVDSVGRATITVDPDLDMDHISLPRDMVWDTAASQIQRQLVLGGMPVPDAIKAIRERSKPAQVALETLLEKNPVFYSRAPAWHRYNAVGGYVKMHDGNQIAINPYVSTGLNADYDGDEVLNQLLVCIPDEALEKWRMSYHKLDSHRVRLSSATKIPALQNGNLFLFDLEDFPHGPLQRTTEGAKGLIDFHTIPHDIFVLSYDETSHKLVWAKVAYWSKHYAREIEIVDTHNGYQLVTDDDPRAVYGTAAGELNLRRFTPTAALAEKVLIPRSRTLPVYETCVTTTPGVRDTETRARNMRETIELTADVGWVIGAFAGDGWATTCRGKITNAAFSDADGWNHQKLHSIIPQLMEDGVELDCQRKEMESIEPGRYGHTVAYVYGSQTLGAWVRDMVGGERGEHTSGSGNKRLPVWYLSAPLEFRQGIFAGLMDTDGSISVSYGKEEPQLMANMGSTSIRLCIELKLLAASLGISGRITPGKTPLGKDCWMVSFSNVDIQKWGGLYMVNKTKLAALRSVKTIEASAVLAKYDIVPVARELANAIKRAIGCPKISASERKMPTAETEEKKETQAHYMCYAQASSPTHAKFGAVSRQVAQRTIAELGRSVVSAMPGGVEWIQVVENADVTWERVTSIQKTGIKEDGYDLTVPGYETFMSADGVILSNTINVHFPVLPATIEEVRTKLMPSKMLFSIRDQDKVVPLPKHEAVLGLYAAQRRPAQRVHRFNTEQEALAAINRKEVSLSDEIEIPDPAPVPLP